MDAPAFAYVPRVIVAHLGNQKEEPVMDVHSDRRSVQDFKQDFVARPKARGWATSPAEAFTMTWHGIDGV